MQIHKTSILDKNIFQAIFSIIAISLIIPILGSVLAVTLFNSGYYEHEPLHSMLEATGVTFAILVLIIIYYNHNTLHLSKQESTWVVSALAAMSLLDLFHSVVHAGNLFVWYHSIAQFLGGVIFAFIWLPLAHARLKIIILSIVVGSLTIGLGSLYFSSYLPLMLVNEKFTLIAKILNITGGIGFFVGGAYFLKNMLNNKSKNSLMLTAHCFLFGSAGILFEVSQMWDMAWWWWHLLRFLAYSVLLHFFFHSIQQTSYALSKSNIELEQKIIERTQGLQESNKDLEIFASTISHDLKTPVRNIVSITTLLQKELHNTELSESAKKYLEWISHSGKLMQEQIESLLSYALIKNSELTLQTVDCNVLVKKIIEELMPSPLKNAEVIVDISVDELPAVYADSLQLGLVFRNLIENAAKYQAAGQQAIIHISARLDSEANVFEFAIADNGIGIEIDYQESIFILFKRLHTQSEYPGTGIGLGLCASIIKRHGGKIWVESDPANKPGSVFKFTLPRPKP